VNDAPEVVELLRRWAAGYPEPLPSHEIDREAAPPPHPSRPRVIIALATVQRATEQIQ